MTLVPGVPEIVGGVFAGALTVIVNAVNAAEAWPSLTLIMMLANDRRSPPPVYLGRGPVVALKVAQPACS